MKKVIVLILVLIIVYGAYRIFRYATLDEGITQKIAEGAVILDVRRAMEYESNHVDGSINISLGSIRERYIELDTSTVYITCCSHGIRSLKVKSLLKEKGFEQVYNGGRCKDLLK